MTQANAIYSTKTWSRRPWGDKLVANAPGLRLGCVEMVHSYTGGIEGEGSLQYLFAYDDEGGGFVGLEKVIGSVGGKSGNFVFQWTGIAKHGRLQQTLVVIPGSGTGELNGLRGQATMECDLHMENYPFLFEYEL